MLKRGVETKKLVSGCSYMNYYISELPDCDARCDQIMIAQNFTDVITLMKFMGLKLSTMNTIYRRQEIQDNGEIKDCAARSWNELGKFSSEDLHAWRELASVTKKIINVYTCYFDGSKVKHNIIMTIYPPQLMGPDQSITSP